MTLETFAMICLVVGGAFLTLCFYIDEKLEERKKAKRCK